MGTRPLSDRAREGLFSSLGHRVVGAKVLDLFAGTGAVGIEALSRGALHATFVDNSRRAVATIEANLKRTKLVELATPVRADWNVFFAHQEPKRYDLVFLDPPYRIPGEEVDAALFFLDEGWLSPGWTVVLTRPRRSYTDVVPVNWQVTRRLEYGDTLVVVYREV